MSVAWLAQTLGWEILAIFVAGVVALVVSIRMYVNAHRALDKLAELQDNAARVFGSIMRDEIEGLDGVQRVLEDLMKGAPDEWALSYELARDRMAAAREQLCRKVGLLDSYLAGTLSMRQIDQLIDQEDTNASGGC